MSSSKSLHFTGTFIKFVDEQLHATVAWSEDEKSVALAPRLGNNIAEAVKKEFLINGNESTHRVRYIVLRRPEVAITQEWTGRMDPEDWKRQNGSVVRIEGPVTLFLIGEGSSCGERFIEVEMDLSMCMVIL